MNHRPQHRIALRLVIAGALLCLIHQPAEADQAKITADEKRTLNGPKTKSTATETAALGSSIAAILDSGMLDEKAQASLKKLNEKAPQAEKEGLGSGEFVSGIRERLKAYKEKLTRNEPSTEMKNEIAQSLSPPTNAVLEGDSGILGGAGPAPDPSDVGSPAPQPGPASEGPGLVSLGDPAGPTAGEGPTGDSADPTDGPDGTPPNTQLKPGDPLIAEIQDFIHRNLAAATRGTRISEDDRAEIAADVDEALAEQAANEGRANLRHQGGGATPADVVPEPEFDAEEEGRANLSRAAQALALAGLAENDVQKMARAASMMLYEMNDNSITINLSETGLSQEDLALLTRLQGDPSPTVVVVPGTPTEEKDDGLKIRKTEERGVRLGETLPPAYAGKENPEAIRDLERRPRAVASLYKKKEGKVIGGKGKKKKKAVGLPAFATKAIQRKKKPRRGVSKSLFSTLMATLRMQGAANKKGAPETTSIQRVAVEGEGTGATAPVRRSIAAESRAAKPSRAGVRLAGTRIARSHVWGMVLFGLFLGWWVSRKRRQSQPSPK